MENKQLADRGYLLQPFCPEDENGLYDIFREVVESGSQFPYDCSSIQEFHSQFLSPQASVYVCRSFSNEIVGGFYIKPNFPGRSRHIANAAYMVRSSHRGQGLGTLIIKASLHIAKDLGFSAMQFNMVLSQNIPAITLYQKLGFRIIATIPDAVRNRDEKSYQDGYIMYRELDEKKSGGVYMTEEKQIVSKEETFDKLDIRLGRVLSVEDEPTAPKKAYRIKVDFGKFGIRTSVGRFTHHLPDEIVGKLVLGVVNFPPRQIGETLSDVLILGVQYPKAESGEATFITPAAQAKIGGKLF